MDVRDLNRAAALRDGLDSARRAIAHLEQGGWIISIMIAPPDSDPPPSSRGAATVDEPPLSQPLREALLGSLKTRVTELKEALSALGVSGH